ncbi:DEAD/DEAH box helicase domain protein [Desulfamplus magnetovallimortis]|uniref:DEAD/DEAH box helicase domain protein n=1 Tax=Desulfamplus magnetovallimortis TaxID=1246637 RepID=A0A1W1H8Y8_9BACT|nr:DEAD/DEAH box helicase [Desulfamplus magnetovallimortis]SLM28913.1 DEAD/DEAH box helicase domain protein [Desulfamplus magnetovallimortis]
MKKGEHLSPLMQLPNTFRPFYGAFPGLYSAQLEAISPILDGRDLILQAATGSGKSEAVLAPCIESIIRGGRKTSLLYIIPTRALAVDLIRRFEPVISERLGLNLAIRTGDLKRSGGKRPDVMFTTPESLDVMLGSTNGEIRAFLGRVGCVIIDEIHPLIFSYRGVHLAHLLIRLERRTGSKIQRIAMSATIADVNALIKAFHFRPFPFTTHITTSVNRKIDARIIHLKNEDREFTRFLKDLHDTWGYRKILVFANSRGACDRLFAIANRMGRFKGVSELHYSNLKPGERKNAENRFRKGNKALCIATSTLELGIDVGDVDAVILYEPPDSVSAFLQRIGRANRRENKVNFWGICRGEQASIQVVRFLALLHLARGGVVESPSARTLPSVMVQQIISCLYEKKIISLPAIEELFLSQKNSIMPSINSSCKIAMKAIFQSLEKTKWLKKAFVSGLFSGGFQYGKHLSEYRIWGNFPETDDEYILELIKHHSTNLEVDRPKAIADIPRSIVNQMDVGDRVYIVGRRLQIVKIDSDEDRRRVFAVSTNSSTDKDIVWLGMGAHVSFEVAQMMRTILKNDFSNKDGFPQSQSVDLIDEHSQSVGVIDEPLQSISVIDDPSLFSRTRSLLESELNMQEMAVILDNGIEVLQGKKTTFLYLTFLGTAGNIVLEWCIRKYIDNKDVFVASNEIGIECSRLVKFEKLKLPESRDSLKKWVGDNINIVRNIIPLNLFSKYLPHELLAEEVTDFLFHQKVIERFLQYRCHTSEVVSGDLSAIADGYSMKSETDRYSLDSGKRVGDDYLNNLEKLVEHGHERGIELSEYYHRIVEITPSTPSLLELEKTKWSKIDIPSIPEKDHQRIKNNQEFPKTLTATMVSDYFIHAQCNRRLYFKYYRCDAPDTMFVRSDEEIALRESALARGVLHEQNVMKALQASGINVFRMPSHKDISAEDRLQAFLEKISGQSPPLYLSQPFLKVDSIYKDRFDLHAIGVPDLVFVDGDKLEVGDIKSSNHPRYHHKWQVAFYALLLKEIVDFHGLGVKVSSRGFLMTRPSGRDGDFLLGDEQVNSVYEKHFFDLEPFMAAFPMLLENFDRTFLSHPELAEHRLQSHCTSCEWFAGCYSNALKNEDIQFLPGITHGALLKLRKMGLYTIEKVHENFSQRYCTIINQVGDEKNEQNFEVSDVSIDSFNKDIEEIDIRPEERPQNIELIDKNFFSTGEMRVLIGRCDAFLNNHILLNKYRTRLYPVDISAYIFIHLIQDRVSQKPAELGLIVLDEHFKVIDEKFWVLDEKLCVFDEKLCVIDEKSWVIDGKLCAMKDLPDERKCSTFHGDYDSRIAVWLEFSDFVSRICNSHISSGKGVFFFHFGEQTKHAILEWGESVLEYLHSVNCVSSVNCISSVNRVSTFNHVSSDSFKKPEFLWQTQPSMWCDLKKLFLTHFHMPAPGTLSLFTLAHILGCNKGIEKPESLFHNISFTSSVHRTGDKRANSDGESDNQEINFEIKLLLETMIELFKKADKMVESQWFHEWEVSSDSESATVARFISEERRLKEEDILDLQELTLHERMEKFRSLAYLRFRKTRMDEERNSLYIFSTTKKTMPSKFRAGDFLRLVSHGMRDLQGGFPVIVAGYEMDRGEISLKSRSGRLNLCEKTLYSLEEDIADFTEAKLSHVADYVFSDALFHPVHDLLAGKLCSRQERESSQWIEKWIQKCDIDLNSYQQAALSLPFHYKAVMIQGPPGTGKTHLLAWILISLIMCAFDRGIPLRIGVSALTHQAIDNVLLKVASLVTQWLPGDMPGNFFPGSCIKWGKSPEGKTKDGNSYCEDKSFSVEYMDDADETLGRTWSIIGATGFGFYNLFNSRNGDFPDALDWVVFDEASQLLLPQALLSIVYAKGNFLFLGDVHQLPPVVMGSYGELDDSLLSRLMAIYPDSHKVSLDITYRMNKAICDFPSRMWYKNMLHPAPLNADAVLKLNDFNDSYEVCDGEFSSQLYKILDPEKPVVIMLAEHEGCSQQCGLEAEIMASVACELMVRYGIEAQRIALISPHRAQNNAIAGRVAEMLAGTGLPLPLVDTVERVQGAERDVILFGITSSDPDHVLSEFLNSPNRLNVAMTRAKKKLIITGSRAFFHAIPESEHMLERNRCFKELLSYCREQGAIIEFFC